MAFKPIAAPRGEEFYNEIISNMLHSKVVKNPELSYLQGESLFWHRDKGCCMYSVFWWYVPEDETFINEDFYT